MSARVYSTIVIENIGDDVYQLISRGHHDPHAFMREVRKEGYDWPLGNPEHAWFKVVPSRDPSYSCYYASVKPGTRGAIPVTVSMEAYGADQYKAPQGIRP